jgi:hypothetical protein
VKRKRLRVVETSVQAHRSQETLYAYADGSLPESQRAQVEEHLGICAACRRSVQEVRRLDLVLKDFPPATAVPFPSFWSKLESRLPSRADRRFSLFRPQQLAAGFALAVVASLIGVVALASDQTLPDSPLYSVKHVRQEVQLSLTSGRERPRLELFLSQQRAHEAAVMVKRDRRDLAVASLKDVQTLLVDAASQLKNASSAQSDAAALKSAVNEIKSELDTVHDENVPQVGTQPTDNSAVGEAVLDAEQAVTQVENGVDQTGSGVTESPSPVLSPSAEASPVGTPTEPPSPTDATASTTP